MSVPIKMQLNKWVQWFASSEELTAVYVPSLYLKDVKSRSYIFQGDFQCEPERLKQKHVSFLSNTNFGVV